VAVWVTDEHGRAIACGAGRDLPRWAAHASCREEDLERLVPALASLPRADPTAAPVALLPRAAALACAPTAALALLLSHREGAPGLGIPALLVVAAAIWPDLAGGRALLRRTWAMRGARVATLARGALVLDGGRTVPLVVAEPPRDARLVERGGTARVALIASGGADPYRSVAHARAVEAMPERRARWVEGAWIAVRATACVAGTALAIAALVPAPPPAEPAPETPAALAGPRPPPPSAWRSEPGPPRAHRVVRRSCPEGRPCQPVLTYVDEQGEEVWQCEGWSPEPCDRRMRELHPELDLSEP
jgi:hypothetical protein